MKTPSFPAHQLPGQGFSCSSVGAALDSGIELLLQPGGALLLANMREFRAHVAIRALARERAAARASVAADDVYPIIHGGAVMVETGPDAVDAEGVASCGSVRATALAVDRRWVAEHLVVAVRKGGIRHEVPSLFTNIFRDPGLARSSVETLSALAPLAGRALVECDVRPLAGAINSGRDVFDSWLGTALGTRHPVTRYVRDVAAALPAGALAWKPPGAGACESLIIVAADRSARDRIITHLRSLEWLATPARLTDGLRASAAKDGWTISAGHRIDLIGAADLGMDPRVAARGTCCALAIAPRIARRVQRFGEQAAS